VSLTLCNRVLRPHLANPVCLDESEVDKAVKVEEKDPMRGRGLNGNIGKAVEESQAKAALSSATQCP
jgi:hypothetical protein